MSEELSIKDVMNKAILSDRTLRYRRNLLLLCVVVLAVTLIEGIDFKNFSILGISFAPTTNLQFHITGVLLLFIAYNAFFYFYYLFWEWRLWRLELVRHRTNGDGYDRADEELHKKYKSYPYVSLYLGVKPFRSKKSPFFEIEKTNWAYSPTLTMWEETVFGRLQDAEVNTTYVHFYYNSIQLVKKIREKIVFFFLVEMGMPLLVVIATMAVLLRL